MIVQNIFFKPKEIAEFTRTEKEDLSANFVENFAALGYTVLAHLTELLYGLYENFIYPLCKETK